MEEKKTFKEVVSEKKEAVKNWVRYKTNQVKYFCQNHPEVVVTFGSTIAVGAGKIVKKMIINSKEQKLKDEYIYDRSGGHYWKLKRKPTKREWQAIDKRRHSGERYSEILSDMNLL